MSASYKEIALCEIVPYIERIIVDSGEKIMVEYNVIQLIQGREFSLLGNINPDGRQNEVVALPATGHMVVLGTAGSGKTTMALLRAVFLANLPEHSRVLVVTFNRALVQYMTQIAGTYPSNITIESYHKFARGYLNDLNKMPRWNGIIENELVILIPYKSIMMQQAVSQRLMDALSC